ncbi:MAG: M24 family metallopeptidase [Candidatus Krumholzibacteriia bacterium]
MTRRVRARHRGKNVLMYAASENDADILYATRFHAPDPFIFVRTAAGRRHLVMSDLELGRARTQSTAHAVHSLSFFASLAVKKYGRRAGAAGVIAAVLRHLRIRGVSVPQRFPLGVADRLRTLGIRVTALPEPFYPERAIKTDVEIREIRKACRATEKGMRAAVDVLARSAIRNGYLIHKSRRLTADRLRSVINTTVLALGYLPSNTIVAPGRQGCDPHDVGSGPIRAGEPVIIDLFPRSEASGYFADMTRTVVRGRASETIQKMYRAVHAGHRLGLSMIRHGANGRAVHEAIEALFGDRGYSTGVEKGRMQGFFHSTGHGLGLEIHEPPRIGRVSAALRKGMVVTVEPGLYYYPHGGVRIEDTVLVTKTGVEKLTRFPRFLEI